MMIQKFSLFLTSFTIGALYSPLLVYTLYLWQQYTGATNLVALHWYELILLLTLMLLPLAAMKLLKINWTPRDIPG
ncbi:MAG: hypothetical protein B6D72_18110 [gamma proteobacterium symbiont of Ctena orbiculata]|nr:hypothetical protein [Candidatus Thiodiazotropha taylori]PUB83890.1 MAG: hypothetical protein DBP00_15550 [gamma proteobacterium symbiont of Ctena orbiculata]MBT2997701.1 hypothetical protein [Candidatus Thiodiazotropha taylori]MBT3027533.1 hypothetical protein [Candidatus Thiodiazotropha taylori]MBT3035004.1 hypothetical protein [Candidatus Thiodiazotropha taylori]